MKKGGCIYGYKKNFDGQTEKSAQMYCQISEGAWILAQCQGPVRDDRGEIYIYSACAAEGTGRKWVYREDEGVSEDVMCKDEGVISAEKRRVWIINFEIEPAGLSVLMRGGS